MPLKACAVRAAGANSSVGLLVDHAAQPWNETRTAVAVVAGAEFDEMRPPVPGNDRGGGQPVAVSAFLDVHARLAFALQLGRDALPMAADFDRERVQLSL